MTRRLLGVAALLLALVLLMVFARNVPPNTIRWETQSEVDTFGYDIYRGTHEQGPFERINPASVPASGTTDLPQRYKYIDTTVEWNVKYWYYIETITLTGKRERLTPVYPARPKSRYAY
ncbi:MAG: hypothetical protein AAF098_07130 [Pseudomonadota bacterium]